MAHERHKQQRMYRGFSFTMPPGMNLVTNKQLPGFNWFRVEVYIWQPQGYYAWETKNFYIEEDVEATFKVALASLPKCQNGQFFRLTLQRVRQLGKLYPGMKFVEAEKYGKRPALYLQADHENTLVPFQQRICFLNDNLLSDEVTDEFKKSWFRAKYWLEDQEELLEA